MKQLSSSNLSLNSPTCWTDGAWKEDSKIGGMGWVLKNPAGTIISQGAASRKFVGSALVAEALAIRMALSKAKELNLDSLHLFSDCSVLISALRSEHELIEIADILHDIKGLATFFTPLYLLISLLALLMFGLMDLKNQLLLAL
ncbi:hypothetical protein Bca101_062600 [Brassica carinata]